MRASPDRATWCSMSCTRKGVVDKEAGQHQQCRAWNIEQRAHGIGQNVVEPRPPAVRPNMPERGDDTIGDDRLQIVGGTRRGD